MDLTELIFLLADAQEGGHSHKCGYSTPQGRAYLLNAGDEPPTGGCGHVWSHKSSDMFTVIDGKQLGDDVHRCPNCGKGLWLDKYRGEGSVSSKNAQQSF